MPEILSRELILVMGVAGSGKTTVGRLLARELDWMFHEADDFHSCSNIVKMRAGTPLDDDDRLPWLLAIRQRMDQSLAEGEPAVFTCSALKASYRDVLLRDIENRVGLVYLRAPKDILRKRIELRSNHFMKATMLESQLIALEEPHDAITINADRNIELMLERIRMELR